MANSLRVALAQIKTRVGVDDNTLAFNADAFRRAYEEAANGSCDIVVGPEMMISGYSPEDLLYRSDVQEKIMHAGDALATEILEGQGPVAIFGSPRLVNGHNTDQGTLTFPQDLVGPNTLDLLNPALANAIMIVDPKSQSTSEIYKTHLPNFSVFDEIRWFAAAKHVADPIDINGIKVGIINCRDVWKEETIAELVERGAQLVVVPNSSPFANHRHDERVQTVSHHARKHGVPVVYVNMIQLCDEIICEGGSFAVDLNGELIHQSKRFEEDLSFIDIEIPAVTKKGVPVEVGIDTSSQIEFDGSDPEEIYTAVTFATQEFIEQVKPGGHVVIGLSGGIDSALVATIAVDVLGADRVHGVLMPSKFTSQESIDLANELAKRLGITAETISIENMHATASTDLGLDAMEPIVSENVQARLRGMTLMMMSNAHHYLVLATSNKSESAVGYATLYGDMVGGYAPIKDVYKTQVFQVCKWRNEVKGFALESPIPQSIIDRPPTAELREGQTDEAALLPYDQLDTILESFIDYEMSVDKIIEKGFDRTDVERIISLVKNSEFKRKQACIGPRLTRRNFGKGRRIPIVAKW
jgi:NAD+ synthetase